MSGPGDGLDRTTYATLVVLTVIAMGMSLALGDVRVALVGCVAVAVPLTFVSMLLRDAWKRRYGSPSTRRT